MTNDRCQRPFDTLERVFSLACAAPSSLSIDGSTVQGLPARAVPLDELRAILLHPSTSYDTRDSALSVLLARARAEGGSATVGLAGVLLFGLRRAVAVFCELCPTKVAEIEAEALVGLIEGIAATDPARRRLAARLTWLARNRARALVEFEMAETARPEHQRAAAAPPPPWGHPDLVLAKAVAEGVLCAEDAALIGDTRLGRLGVAQAAQVLGIERSAAHKRRQRAEKVLADWLASPDYEPGFVHKPPSSPYFQGKGRPRNGRSVNQRPETCRRVPSRGGEKCSFSVPPGATPTCARAERCRP